VTRFAAISAGSIAWALALAAAVASVGICVALRRWPERKGEGERPRCRQCGYTIIEGGSVVCSECGSDLRQVGLVTPGNRRPSGWKVPMATWLVLLTLPAGYLGYLWQDYQPLAWTYRTFDDMGTFAINKDAAWAVAIRSAGTGRYFGLKPSWISVRSNLPGQYPGPYLWVDPSTFTCTLFPSQTRQARQVKLDADAVDLMLELCPPLPEEARDDLRKAILRRVMFLCNPDLEVLGTRTHLAFTPGASAQPLIAMLLYTSAAWVATHAIRRRHDRQWKVFMEKSQATVEELELRGR
jgi:hypothetical protein